MQIRTNSGGFSEVFKLKLVGQIEAGLISQAEAMRKYSIYGHSTILKWCRKYGNKHYKKQIQLRPAMKKKKDSFETQKLENEIKSLKQELEQARLKNVVLDTLVDVAEKEFGIPIRKKYGAKQSEK